MTLDELELQKVPIFHEISSDFTYFFWGGGATTAKLMKIVRIYSNKNNIAH